MYEVTMINNAFSTKIHGRQNKLASGSVVQGINTIDSFSFSVFMSNPAFSKVKDFTTLIEVYNTNKQRYEFSGRVLYTAISMDESGKITNEVTCESCLGYLCDSVQGERKSDTSYTVRSFLNSALGEHNALVESYKHFQVGVISEKLANRTIIPSIESKNTFDTIKEVLIDGKDSNGDALGGEIKYRKEGGTLYIDYLERIGEEKTTEIALSKNMKSITKERDPSSYVTRLIPIGYLVSEDDEGNEVRTQIDISSQTGGVHYVDDAEGIENYGIHASIVDFGDVANDLALVNLAKRWLKENNRVSVKYTVTALDLSLIGMDIDDFEVGSSYPVKNPLLGIADIARIIKKTIDVCEETKTSFEIGESFKTLSDIQKESYENLVNTTQTVKEIQTVIPQKQKELENSNEAIWNELGNKLGAGDDYSNDDGVGVYSVGISGGILSVKSPIEIVPNTDGTEQKILLMKFEIEAFGTHGLYLVVGFGEDLLWHYSRFIIEPIAP